MTDHVEPAKGAEVETSKPHRHLAVVNTETGEQLDECPQCRDLKLDLQVARDEADGLQDVIRSQAAKMRAMKRDREAEAKRSEHWPAGVEAFAYWKTLCRHPRSSFTAARFELVEPFIEKHGLELVKLAIEGAAYDPHRASKPSRNGKVEVYDAFETIFKSPASFERHMKRAPREAIDRAKEQGLFAATYTATELRIKAEVILEVEAEGDFRELPDRVEDAVARARAELEGRALAT